jgi:predicted MFS family arabinose efflux permease
MKPDANNGLVILLSLGTFIIFFQGFMVAPILPELSSLFHVSVRHVSFIEPAYLLSYGIATLIYAPLSDYYGRTHPLFAAIITSLSNQKGVAIGLFAFVMFMGYGLGSLVFSLIINIGLNESFLFFGGAAAFAALLSVSTFRNEK